MENPYTKYELSKLGGGATIKINSERGSTNWMNLNQESAEAIVKMLAKAYNITL